MAKTLISLVGFLFFIVNTSGQMPTYNSNLADEIYGKNNDTEDTFQPSENTTEEFDWSIFKKLSEMSNNNLLISPFSLKVAMAILYQSAAGQTEDEIRWVLKFENKTENLNKYKGLLEQFQTLNSKYQLNIGTRMYIDKSFTLQQKFREILKSSFKTDMKEFDVSYPEKTADDANSWVENFTNGNIKNLVDKEDIENAVVLLLNTIYYKGSWVKQFQPKDTEQGKFFTNSTSYVNVQMMKQNERFYYTESKLLDAQIIRLPYMGGNLSMYIVVPKTHNGLSTLIQTINNSRLNREIHLLELTDVKLTLPKFNYDYTAHLVAALKEMGIHDLFDHMASIPGISRGRGLTKKLLVSNILQKSGIEISETGTVAYTATEVSLVNKFGDGEEVEFTVDRPFLFYIGDEHSKQILFMGKVENPTDLTPKNQDEEDDKGAKKSGNV